MTDADREKALAHCDAPKKEWLLELASYFEGGGSRFANLHESAGSWAANEIREIAKDESNLRDFIGAGE